MTPELLNFHQVISDIQLSEENMLDNHKQTCEEMAVIYKKAVELLRTTDEVTYDQDCKFRLDLMEVSYVY